MAIVAYLRVVALHQKIEVCGQQLVSPGGDQQIAALSNCEPLSPSAYYYCYSRPQLRRNLSFRVTTIYTTPTSSMASFVYVILTGQLLVHLWNISNAE